MEAMPSVLFMDDDEIVCNVASSMLNHLGYSVTTCSKGEDAIEHYLRAKESGNPFASVILDVVIIGGIGGPETAKEILRFDPHATLIISSGNHNEPVMTDPDGHGFHTSLAKPYTLDQMAKTMATVRK